jgi:hypothetical protein
MRSQRSHPHECIFLHWLSFFHSSTFISSRHSKALIYFLVFEEGFWVHLNGGLTHCWPLTPYPFLCVPNTFFCIWWGHKNSLPFPCFMFSCFISPSSLCIVSTSILVPFLYHIIPSAQLIFCPILGVRVEPFLNMTSFVMALGTYLHIKTYVSLKGLSNILRHFFRWWGGHLNYLSSPFPSSWA